MQHLEWRKIVDAWAAELGETPESQRILSKAVTRAECELEMFRYKLNRRGIKPQLGQLQKAVKSSPLQGDESMHSLFLKVAFLGSLSNNQQSFWKSRWMILFPSSFIADFGTPFLCIYGAETPKGHGSASGNCATGNCRFNNHILDSN